jgi:crotonobetainyl-CoA:carnitine CoA-transferase CaiB-like acyl-CoA transferase
VVAISLGYEPLLTDYQRGLGLSRTADPTLGALPVDRPYLAATLPVLSLAAGSVAAYAVAANRLRHARGLAPQPHQLRPDRIAAGFGSERLLRLDNRPVAGFAALSGFFATADGMVRTHANYPHHRDRLLSILDLPADAERGAVAARLAARRAADVENAAAAHGAIAVRVRAETEWAGTDAGRAAATGPIVAGTPRADAGAGELPGAPTVAQPLRGIRVLDLTRVLAGPVATRALALLGARVLRLDPPWLPEIPWQHTDTGQGKYTARLDLRRDRDHVAALLRAADVIVTGYRPGALDAAGLEPAAIHPGIVHGRVSAWGQDGPWAARRGFDSIVQAACGIALLEGDPGPGTPGALPAQALDYGSGYLLAAGVLDALAARTADGQGRDVAVALARTASWLLARPDRTPEHPEPVLPDTDVTVRHGTLVTARPVLAEYPDYPWPAHPHGTDPAAFPQSRPGSPAVTA